MASSDGELEDGEVHEDRAADLEESGEASGCEGPGEREQLSGAFQTGQLHKIAPSIIATEKDDHDGLPASLQSPPRHRGDLVLGKRTRPPAPDVSRSRPKPVAHISVPQPQKVDRETEELLSVLKELTRSSTFQDVMRSLDTVSKDLKQAIKKLDKVFRRVRRRKGDSIEDYPDCFQFSRRILEGLHNINRFSCTSAFQAAEAEPARALFKAAMNYRHDIFNAALKAELEQLVRSSKAFKCVLDKGGSGAAAAAGGRGGTPNADTSRPAVSGSKSPGVQQEEQRAGAEQAPGDGQEEAGVAGAGEPTPAAKRQRVEESGEAHQAAADGDAAAAEAASGGAERQAAGPPLTSPAAASPPPPAAGAAKPSLASAPAGAGCSSSRVGSTPGSFKLRIVVASTPGDLSAARAAAAEPEAMSPRGGTAAAVKREAEGGERPQQEGAARERDWEGRGRGGAHAATSSSSGRDRGRDHAAPAQQQEQQQQEQRPALPLHGPAAPLQPPESPVSGPGEDGWGQPGQGGAGQGQADAGAAAAAPAVSGASGRDKEKDRDKEKERVHSHSHHSRDKDRDRHRDAKGSERDRDRDKGREKDREKERDKERDREPQRRDSGGSSHRVSGSRHRSEPHSHSHSHAHRDAYLAAPDTLHPHPDPDSVGDPFQAHDHSHAHSAENGPRSKPPPPPAGACQLPPSTGVPPSPTPHPYPSPNLALVVDLDGVAADSVAESLLDAHSLAVLERRLTADATLPPSRRELFRLELGTGAGAGSSSGAVWVKLRPGVRPFLARCHERFELWAHSRQGRPFADAVSELLDPSQQLFGSRVVAQGVLAKRQLATLEARVGAVVVLDTPNASWMADGRSLLAAPPYPYFAARAVGLGLGLGGPGASLLEVDRDECPEQGVLAGMLPVLEAVQGRVAAAAAEARGGGSGGSEPHGPEGGGLPPTDVRRALREQRRQVLAGVHIVFSRLFPNARRAQGAAGQQEGAHGEQDDVEASHPLWLLAQSCGAVCSTQCSEETTHVVASCAETDKGFWAFEQGRCLVHPTWLECSSLLWRRMDESPFLLEWDGVAY